MLAYLAEIDLRWIGACPKLSWINCVHRLKLRPMYMYMYHTENRNTHTDSKFNPKVTMIKVAMRVVIVGNWHAELLHSLQRIISGNTLSKRISTMSILTSWLSLRYTTLSLGNNVKIFLPDEWLDIGSRDVDGGSSWCKIPDKEEVDNTLHMYLWAWSVNIDCN